MTDPAPKSGKSVAPPETVRLFEILGYGSINEEESQRMVKNIMEVTGCAQDTAIVTLHDCHDESEAIQRLLDSTSSAPQEGWVTKKKSNKKKIVFEPPEVASPEPPKAYVTDGHTGEGGFEFRRGNKYHERYRDNVTGGRRERRGVQKKSEESWDGEETTEAKKSDGSSRFDEDRQPQMNGYYYTRNPRRYGQENRREEGLDWDQEEDRGYQSYKKKDTRYSRPRRPQRDENDSHVRGEWSQREKPRTYRHKNDNSARRFEDWSANEPNFTDHSAKKASKSPQPVIDIEDDSSIDKIDWENLEFKRTDWGADEEADIVDNHNSDDEYDDKRIENILTQGLEICNSNYESDLQPDVPTNPPPATHVTESTSNPALSQPSTTRTNGVSYPIFSPQTTSLPTPSASIPESRPHSHHQAMGEVLTSLDKMNLKRKVRSKIPQAPVELPKRVLDSLDMPVQFGNIDNLDNLTQEHKEPEMNPKLPDALSSPQQANPVSGQTLQETNKPSTVDDDSNKNEPTSTPTSPLPKSPPPPVPRSPVPDETQALSDPPSSHPSGPPSHSTAPPAIQQHAQYQQHMNRQTDKKSYPDNSGKMHHHAVLPGNPVPAKMQQHPQMAPMNSAEQPAMPFLMAPMANHSVPNSLPSTIPNMPRGTKNYPMLYNAQGVAPQFSMMPNFYVDQEMMRMMTSQASPAPNMMKDQNSNPAFPNNDSKFHEPTSPGNPQSGIPAYVNFPIHGYLPNFFPNFFPMMPKGNPVTPTAGQTPYQTQPPIPPNISAMPEPHGEYKATYPAMQQKPGIPQPNEIQNMYKAFEQKPGYSFNFGYPMPPYVTPQMVPQAMSQQQQQQYPNMTQLHQQNIDPQRQKW